VLLAAIDGRDLDAAAHADLAEGAAAARRNAVAPAQIAQWVVADDAHVAQGQFVAARRAAVLLACLPLMGVYCCVATPDTGALAACGLAVGRSWVGSVEN